MRIGLLGGSFNPPHAGHFFISKQAQKKMQLDRIWWVVSPQNPLKSSENMADFSAREAACSQFMRNRKIELCTLEALLSAPYTTHKFIDKLKKHCVDVEFFWIIGSDNLEQLQRWFRWKNLSEKIDFIIFDRGKSWHRSVRSKSNICLRKRSKKLFFMHGKKHQASSSLIRDKIGFRKKL
jgi:nicotinate-nucleotide adenylyltransferase